MRRLLYLGVASILVLTLSGCGGDSRSDFVAEIFSDQQADGDIAFNPVSNSFTVTNGPDTILFGIDESNLDLPEFRAFLDFPLDGSTNQDVVPAGAEILSATLEVFVNEVSFAGTVPTLLDLVPFSVNGLTPADFDSPPLQFPNGTDATLSFDGDAKARVVRLPGSFSARLRSERHRICGNRGLAKRHDDGPAPVRQVPLIPEKQYVPTGVGKGGSASLLTGSGILREPGSFFNPQGPQESNGKV
jgi:hypothetical protein